MSSLRISIVTPSFNQAHFIERTIRSVLEQRGDFTVEYRVLDGGSTDATISILRRYENRLAWISEPDDGQVDAINKGLRAATGDIVGWLNSDDMLLPGALQKVAEAFSKNPKAEWLHGRCEIVDTNDKPIRRWISHYKDFRAQRYSFDSLLTENYISQMTTFWRRRVHEQIGYLDPSVALAFDYDFWLRLAKRGDPIYVKDRIACFRWYESSKSGANFERQFREAAEISARYADARARSIAFRKKLKLALFLFSYRVMTRLRRPAKSSNE